MSRWLVTIAGASLVALAALAAAGCGDNLDRDRPQLEVDPAAASVALGRDLTLTARYVAGDGALVPGDELTWTSSAPTIATVTAGADGTAIVHGVALGPAVITAQGGGEERAAMISVRAAEVASIAIDPPAPVVPAGACTVVHLLATRTDGVVVPVDGTQVSWSTVAGVIAVGADGTLCWVRAGDDAVVARYAGLVAHAPVTIGPASRTGIFIEAPFILHPGEVDQALAFMGYSDGTTEDVTDEVTWSLLGPGVVTVSASGQLVAIAPGFAQLRATLDGFTADFGVQVQPFQIVEIRVTPSPVTVAPGGFVQLTALAELTDGSLVDVTAVATWWSSAPAVATVGPDGLVRGTAPGLALVAAEHEFLRGAALVTVE